MSPLLVLAGQLVAMLGPVLLPILDMFAILWAQMAPLVAAVADALSALLGPILAQLPTLISPFVTILNTLTGTLLPVLTQLIQQLPLAQLGQSFAAIAIALGPLLSQLAVLIGQGLQVLMPLLLPIIATVSKLATIFAGELARTVEQIVVPALTMLTQLLSGDLDGAVASAGKVLSGLAQMVVREFVLLPGQVMLALWDLGNSLWDAGLKITDSLVRGIKSGLGKVKDTLSDLTDMLPSWKGPADRDGRLLTPAGQLIMDGLMVGIGSRVPALRGQLQGLTSEIGGMGMGRLGAPQLAMAGGMGAAGPGGGLSIQNYYEAESGSARGTAEELMWLSKGRG
jgi:phage-related protein